MKSLENFEKKSEVAYITFKIFFRLLCGGWTLGGQEWKQEKQLRSYCDSPRGGGKWSEMVYILVSGTNQSSLM